MRDPYLQPAEKDTIFAGLNEKSCSEASRNLLKEIPTQTSCKTIPEPPSALLNIPQKFSGSSLPTGAALPSDGSIALDPATFFGCSTVAFGRLDAPGLIANLNLPALPLSFSAAFFRE